MPACATSRRVHDVGPELSAQLGDRSLDDFARGGRAREAGRGGGFVRLHPADVAEDDDLAVMRFQAEECRFEFLLELLLARARARPWPRARENGVGQPVLAVVGERLLPPAAPFGSVLLSEPEVHGAGDASRNPVIE